MQVVKKTFIILFVVWFTAVLFMPKRNFYYKVEHMLLPQDIKINEGTISEGLFSLQIDNAEIYVKGINLIHLKEASLFSLLFYSRIELQEIIVDDSLRSMVPGQLDEVVLSHVIWQPQMVSVSGHGAFGTFKGEVNLVQRQIHIDFAEVDKLGILKDQLKKGKRGWYYETSF
jgi:hypothetical protein